MCLVNPFQVEAASNYGGSDRPLVNGYANLASQNTQVASVSYIETTVNTPQGNPVDVFLMIGDVSDDEKNRVHVLGDSVSSSNHRLSQATMHYNCHSYAWYSQNTSSNQFWMNDPSEYYSDGSYYEVSTPTVGDIICYFDNNGTPSTTVDDTNLHSGIVVQSYGTPLADGLAGCYEVESKWGGWALYRHNGYECIYTDHVLTVDTVVDAIQPSSSDIADYVKFYRRSGHTHNFNTYNDFGNDEYHQSICSCGMIIHQPHNWVLHYGKSLEQRGVNYIPEYYCAQCNAFTLHPT